MLSTITSLCAGCLDAYNNRLVKKIEVKGFEVKNFRGTDSYLFLEKYYSVKNPMAKNRVWRDKLSEVYY